jgi:hypothetical protein
MMEPDRFDDVAFTVTEEPQELSPRNRLRRRMTAVLTAATIVFGGMAAAADALTQSAQPAKSSASPSLTRDGDGARPWRRGHPCHKGDRDHRGASTSELRY